MAPQNNYGCVSYPTAKALMLAGVEFETNICYNEEGGIFEAKGSGEILYLKTGKFSHIGTVDFVAAPAFEDIWNALPNDIKYKGGFYEKCLKTTKGGNMVGYFRSLKSDVFGSEAVLCSLDSNIVEGAAKLLLQLKYYNII